MEWGQHGKCWRNGKAMMIESPSTEPRCYRVLPELRRGAIYVMVASPLLCAVCFWVAHFIAQRDVICVACSCSLLLLLGLAMVLPLRWALCVDNQGIARRLVFRWDLWTWRDLASGRIRLAELHWYEAHGTGRRKLKIKRFLD